MRIAMLSDSEALGGAAVAASRLAVGLSLAGQEVQRLVQHSTRGDWPWRRQMLHGQISFDFLSRLKRKLISEEARVAEIARSVEYALDGQLRQRSADVINIHNIHGAVGAGWSVDLVRVCARHAPVVWTLHDMWSFTGRCAYNYDCRRFETGCDETCPTPTEYPALRPQLIRGAWEQRRRLYAQHPDIAVVTPSRWLADEARRGLWRGHRVEIIPNGLPLDTYKPLDRAMAREALGVEGAAPVLLASAQDWSDRRKGGQYLTEALRRLGRPVTVMVLGWGKLPQVGDGVHVHALGYVDHERTKVLTYSAADLFVHPAPVDNLPNVVMEAIACGTPVVGFPIGGVPEMVRPRVTGWLAAELSSEALARTVAQALDQLAAGLDLRRSCRAVAEAEYGQELQAKRYLKLFEELISARRGTVSAGAMTQR